MAKTENLELDDEGMKVYTKGFNAGYLLQKEAPKELEQLTKGKDLKKSDVFTKGLFEGSKEYRREKFKEELYKIDAKNKQRDNELDK